MVESFGIYITGLLKRDAATLPVSPGTGVGPLDKSSSRKHRLRVSCRTCGILSLSIINVKCYDSLPYQATLERLD